MEKIKTNDSGFKLDISADTSALGSSLSNNENIPSNIIDPLPDVQNPQSVDYSTLYLKDIQLPESMLFEPTPIQVQPTVQPYKSAIADSNFSVKIQPEEVLKKATQVENNLELLKKDVQSISNQMRNPDSRLNQQDNYEEKITIPAQNDIFSDRKNKMSKYPEWR